MKVRCRGYEGELAGILPTVEGRQLNGEYKVIDYEIKIAVANGLLTLERVKDNEIEFIKE